MTEVLTFSQGLYAFMHISQSVMYLAIGVALIIVAIAFYRGCK